MATNEKAAPGAGRAARGNAFDTRDSTTPDRVVSWHALGAFAKQNQATKPSHGKRRQPSRGVKS